VRQLGHPPPRVEHLRKVIPRKERLDGIFVRLREGVAILLRPTTTAVNALGWAVVSKEVWIIPGDFLGELSSWGGGRDFASEPLQRDVVFAKGGELSEELLAQHIVVAHR
jgi:hypothetical protein